MGVAGVQQSCCCSAIACPVAFAPLCDRQQDAIAVQVGWLVGLVPPGFQPRTTVVRPLGDMRRRDGPRPPKRSSRDDGDLRRAHPQQYPQHLKHQHGAYPTADLLTTLPTMRMAVGSLLLSIQPCHHRSYANSLGREPCRRYLSDLFYRHPRDWVEGTYYIQVRQNEGPSHDCRVARADIAVFVRRSQATLY